MKINYVALATTLLMATAGFSQKDELKTLKKIYTKESVTPKDVVDFKANVVKLAPLATEEGDKVYANFYKSMIPVLEMKSMGAAGTPEKVAQLVTPEAIKDIAANLNATIDYEKKTGKKVYTDNIAETVKQFKPSLLNYAIVLGDQKKYKEGAEVLYAIYQLDKSDQNNLYYASNFAINSKDYDLALQYYNELKALNYSGEETRYYAKNISTGSEDSFATKTERDNFIKFKTHSNPREEKMPSKRGEIYRNIALIYVDKGRVEDAKKAIVEARAANPDDSSLIITEADLYLKSKDFTNYEKLVKEAIEKNPKDASLQYNLGVIAAQSERSVDAEKYYLKAIEIDPNYINAYINLAILKLAPESAVIDQMNKLGTTPAENKKYEVLKKQRLEIFNSAIPYLEKAVQLDPKNYDAAKTLLNVYNALEITDKAAPLKVKVKEMENKM